MGKRLLKGVTFKGLYPYLACLQVDHSGVVVEELATILGYLRGNAIWVFDFFLAKFIQNTAETVVPLLFLLGCLAWVGSTELNKQFLTYHVYKSVCVQNGGDSDGMKPFSDTHQ
jgi:hypothetical protein